MDQYLSVYQKDYTWSRAKKSAVRTTPEYTVALCTCSADPKSVKLPKKYEDSFKTDSHEWSRIGPMGPLLDPKLYRVKVGPRPETEATKFDQPNTYLKKLKEKYPNLYGVMRDSPSDEMRKRVDVDRLKTVYQVDYSDPNFYEGSTTASELHPLPCAVIKSSDVDCQPHVRPPLPKHKPSKDDRNGFEATTRRSKRRPEEEGIAETKIPPWKSEYQDVFSKTGQMIMKYKLHNKKEKAVTPWPVVRT